MKIWVDADACPVAIKEILFKAVLRTEVKLTLVANQYLRTPSSPLITLLQVEPGFDIADNEIVKRVDVGDLVVTNDIPLAAAVIDLKAQALSPRGELFTKDNVGPRLNMRDFMDTMRASGVQTPGPPPMGLAERQAFASHLDKILSRWNRQTN